MPTTGKATIQAVRELQPDVLLQDMMLGDMSGTDIIRMVRQEFPSIRIFAMSAKPALAKLALDEGANGCMLKEDHPQVIQQALNWDIQKGVWISPLLENRLLVAAHELQKHDFTATELKALRLSHLSNTEIAVLLKLSEGTVRNLFTAIYQKTDISSRGDLAQWAQNVLLLSPTQNV